VKEKSAFLLAAGFLLLTGCGGGSGTATVQQTTPEYSLVIEDVTQTLQADSESETASAETTSSAASASAAQTRATTETAVSVYQTDAELSDTVVTTAAVIEKNGTYTTKEDVALYIYTYGELPQNFITKKEAQALGWTGGSLEPYAPGKCIGGTYFGNYEGNLPEKAGRSYTECDIDTLGKSSRGAKRIVFSNDGLIYYTEDHYSTFELLYGEE